MLKNITRRNKKFQVTKKRGCSTLNYDSMNAGVEQELQDLMTEQNSMNEQIQKLKQSLANMQHQITSIKSKMRFPELSNNQGNETVFLQQMHLKEIKDPASKNDAKNPRLTELKITESEVNNEDKIEILIPKVTSADNLGNSIQATKENAESFEFLKRILEDDTWFSIEGEGDLPVNYFKAIVEPDMMMESYRAMDGGNLKEKASDQDADDDVSVDLWA